MNRLIYPWLSLILSLFFSTYSYGGTMINIPNLSDCPPVFDIEHYNSLNPRGGYGTVYNNESPDISVSLSRHNGGYTYAKVYREEYLVFCDYYFSGMIKESGFGFRGMNISKTTEYDESGNITDVVEYNTGPPDIWLSRFEATVKERYDVDIWSSRVEFRTTLGTIIVRYFEDPNKWFGPYSQPDGSIYEVTLDRETLKELSVQLVVYEFAKNGKIINAQIIRIR